MSSLKNEQHKKLFGVDVFEGIAHPDTRFKGPCEYFETRVRIEVLENVQAEHVTKFIWSIDQDAPENQYISDRAVLVNWE